MMYLNLLLEKQEQVKPKISRWKEIIKIKAEINETDGKKLTKSTMKQKVDSFKVSKIDKNITNLAKIRSGEEDMIIKTNETQKIMRKHFENLYSNILEDLKKWLNF
jgi:hypothetical protein